MQTIFSVQGSVIEASGNATDADILEQKNYSNNSGTSTGTMPNNTMSITPSTSAQTITQGYHDGTGSVSGDTDLQEGNVREGISIFMKC